jgi:hypothetical protein
MVTEIETAEAAVRSLEDKRQQLNERAVALADERNAIAYDAHVAGEQKARKRLDAINQELAVFASEASSVEAAINEATQRLGVARLNEAQATDRMQALQVREKLARFVELGGQVDDCLWDLAQSLNAMIPLLHEMHQLGQQAPTSEQFRINATMAVKSMLQELPQVWVRDFEFQRLSPNQKKRFGEVCAGWHTMIASQINARLPSEPEKTKEGVAA